MESKSSTLIKKADPTRPPKLIHQLWIEICGFLGTKSLANLQCVGKYFQNCADASMRVSQQWRIELPLAIEEIQLVANKCISLKSIHLPDFTQSLLPLFMPQITGDEDYVKRNGYELMSRVMRNNGHLANIELAMWLTGDMLDTILKHCPKLSRLVGRYHRPFSKDMDDRTRHWQISEVLARSGIRQIEVYDLVWSEQAAQALLQVAKNDLSILPPQAGSLPAIPQAGGPITSAGVPRKSLMQKLKTPRKLVLDAQSLSAGTLAKLIQMPSLTSLEVGSFPELSPGTILASTTLQRLHAGAHSLPLLSALQLPMLTHLTSFRDAYVGNYPRAHNFAEFTRLLISSPRLVQLQLTVTFSDWTSEELKADSLPGQLALRDLEIYFVHGCRDNAIREFASRASAVMIWLVRKCPHLERFVCSAQHQHNIPVPRDQGWDNFLANPTSLCPNMKRMYVTVDWAQKPVSWIP